MSSKQKPDKSNSLSTFIWFLFHFSACKWTWQNPTIACSSSSRMIKTSKYTDYVQWSALLQLFHFMMTVVRMYSYNHKLNPTHYSNVAITVNTYSLLSSKDKEYNRVKTTNRSKITFIWWDKVVGYVSSSSCFIAAVPLNKSNCVPGGNSPMQ